jgi:uncharacterized spore protein YtfJ
MSVESNVKTTAEEILRLLSTKNVVGEPIELEDKVLIPVTKFGVGFGTGVGSGKATGGGGGEGVGGGAGAGAGVSPEAVIVVFKGVKGPEGIKVLPLSTPGPVSKALGEIASTIMERMREKKESPKKEDKEIVPNR